MATRMVTDCDRCGSENIGGSSYRLEVPVQKVFAGELNGEGTETKRVDLDTKCLGIELQNFLEKLTPEEGKAWYERVSKNGKKTGK